MDILYASIKHDIILAIERSVIATYAKIDFRKADSFGLCLNKHVQGYQRLLSELDFTPFMEEIGIILFFCQDKNPSAFANLSKLKKTLDEQIRNLENNRV